MEFFQELHIFKKKENQFNYSFVFFPNILFVGKNIGEN